METYCPVDPFDVRNVVDRSKIIPKEPPPVKEVFDLKEEVFISRNFGNDPAMVLVEKITQKYVMKTDVREIDDILMTILDKDIKDLIYRIISALLVKVDVKYHASYREYLSGKTETVPESQPIEDQNAS
jgi:hypothetical protein